MAGATVCILLAVKLKLDCFDTQAVILNERSTFVQDVWPAGASPSALGEDRHF